MSKHLSASELEKLSLPPDFMARLAGEPLLLSYQQGYLDTVSRHAVTVVEKSRRIGFTWATAAHAVLTAAATKAAGGMDVYYLAYEKEMTREFIDTCAAWARLFDQACSSIDEVVFGRDGDKDILAFRISFASGYEIIALSSSPRNLRGRQGLVIIDEAAFHDNLEEVLKAAFALLIWGGKVVVISTHDGQDNPFYKLVEDARAGRDGRGYQRVTFDDALAAGLYKRICLVAGQAWSAGAETSWRAGIIAQYGEGADEELFCTARAGGGAWISPDLIAAARDRDAGRPELYQGGRTYIGNDIARRADNWVATALEQVGELLVMRDERVLKDAPFRQQEDDLAAMVAGYRTARVAMDQTGMGEQPVERAKERWGDLVDGVLMTGPRRLAVATAARKAFEDGTIRISDDDGLAADLRKIRRISGPTGAPRLLTGRDASGHADRAWALFLAIAAASAGGEAEYGYLSVDRGPGGGVVGWLPDDPDDTDTFAYLASISEW